jgi:hypothetical protein
MKSMKMRTRTVVTLTQENGFNFELSGVPVFPDDVITEALSNGMTTVGYLERDEDVPHPLEDCDGMGKIYRWDRDAPRGSKQRGFEEIGLDQYGARDPDATPNPYAVLLDKYEHGAVNWSVAGSLNTEHWDTSRGAGVWVPDESCLEHIKATAIKRMLPDGVSVGYQSQLRPDGTCKFRPCKPGEVSHFSNGMIPDERATNVITITFPDGSTKGGYATFVTAYRAAARKLGSTLNKKDLVKAEQDVARECAEQACKAYTAWCNGECFGFVVDVFDASGNLLEDNGDACGGYIGTDDGEASLHLAMDTRKKVLLQQTSTT